MSKLLCKRILIVASVVLCVVVLAVLAFKLGVTEASENEKKANSLIYCAVAVLLTVVMFNSIIKITDRKIKIYFIILFCLFSFWLAIKFFDKVALFNDDNDYTWYLLYVPLLFIPSMWFIVNNQIYIKNKKYKKFIAIISLLISLLLFLLVFTNDFHQFVFVFPNGVEGSHSSDYKYNVGYFIIYAFIFIEILTTIILFYSFSVKKIKIRQKIFPSIVILIILIYSIFYVVTGISIPYLSDMTLVYTILGTVLVYVSLKCGLIKNSGAYFEFFETCNVPLAIVNEKMDVQYQNKRYKEQKTNKNMILKKQKLNLGTLLVLEDVENLKNLQATLKNEVAKLEYSNKILEKNKEVLQKEKQLEQRSQLHNKVEQQIKSKKIILERLLNELPIEINEENKNQTKETLNAIKIIVGYLKRKTSLILVAEQKNEMSTSELKLLFTESFNDLKWFGVNAGIGLEESLIPVDTANKFYDIYNELLTKIRKNNIDVWITLKKRKVWEFEMTFDGIKIDKPKLNLPKEYKIDYSFLFNEDCTIICFKEVKSL